mmetsp:Transcript_133452/g.231967  ORF Transcript_133452/g.231967 Transcript_133452/m.231967 type:complete len:537 (-) Transcript_133452:61-1671(-)
MSLVRGKGVLDRQYTCEYEVGLWTFGTLSVLKERDTGSLRNCKTVPKNLLRRTDGVLERLRRLQGLTGTHICAITDVLEDASNFFVISEYSAGGDVADWISRMDEGEFLQETTCATYMRQACLALQQCHSQKIFHRDLQPNNLMLSSKMPDASVKVSDIGLATIFDPDNSIVQRQPSPYTAPEVRNTFDPVSTGETDMWSLGAIAQQLLTGHPPSDRPAMDWLSRLSGRRSSSDWADRSEIAKDFVDSLVQPAPVDRATAARALQHPWLKSLVPLTGVQLNADTDVAREVRHKTLCYTLAVLLIPVLVPYRDFEQLCYVFREYDKDADGMVNAQGVQRILVARCSLTEAVQAALVIVDIGKTRALDLCAAACADLIAREFFAAGPTGRQLAGLLRASDVAPRMLQRFFEVYGERGQPAAALGNIRTRLRTATARDMEKFAGVEYEDILDTLPANRLIDTQMLTSQLSANAGRGTPLSADSYLPVRETDGLAGLQLGLLNFFQTCSADVGKPEESLEISVAPTRGSRGSRLGPAHLE